MKGLDNIEGIQILFLGALSLKCLSVVACRIVYGEVWFWARMLGSEGSTGQRLLKNQSTVSGASQVLLALRCCCAKYFYILHSLLVSSKVMLRGEDLELPCPRG